MISCTAVRLSNIKDNLSDFDNFGGTIAQKSCFREHIECTTTWMNELVSQPVYWISNSRTRLRCCTASYALLRRFWNWCLDFSVFQVLQINFPLCFSFSHAEQSSISEHITLYLYKNVASALPLDMPNVYIWEPVIYYTSRW